MQEEYSLLKEENFQLKNEISQLKNAFDLNRDILKIISEEAKHTNPRIQMLYQIINRLTSINNQIMINTAELIQQKNCHKFQKQTLKRQNEIMKERIDEMVQNEQLYNKNTKINELSLYFKNKINDLENEMKALEEERILKEHEILFLKKKLQYYQGQQKKLSIIPTIDKNNPQKKLIEPPPSTLLPPLKDVRKHITNKQTKLQMKVNILNKEMNKLKIYCEELEYRLAALIKVMQLGEDVKRKDKDKDNIKRQHRKSLQEVYSHQITEVKLLKFAINNLVKEEQEEGKGLMFTITTRQLNNPNKNSNENNHHTRDRYLYKSVQKQNKVKMKPILNQTENQQKQTQ